MTENGKIKHRVHVLIFLRGETRAQDTMGDHGVTTRNHFQGTLRRLWRCYGGCFDHTAWVADEAYWRVHGIAGRR